MLNAPVTAAATAVRYSTSADASLMRLSPSRITTTRRGTGSRETMAAAATASGGETIAPNATATAQGIPGRSAWIATATAPVVARTNPTASSPMGRRFDLNSRSDVKNAAAQRMGGRKTKKTRSGSSSGILIPGTKPIASPAMTCRIGVGTGSRLANAVSAMTSAATAIAKMTGWNGCMRGRPGIGTQTQPQPRSASRLRQAPRTSDADQEPRFLPRRASSTSAPITPNPDQCGPSTTRSNISKARAESPRTRR